MNAATVTARPTARPGGRANTLLWAAQVVLAAFFAAAAVPKLAGAHTAVTMFGATITRRRQRLGVTKGNGRGRDG